MHKRFMELKRFLTMLRGIEGERFLEFEKEILLEMKEILDSVSKKVIGLKAKISSLDTDVEYEQMVLMSASSRKKRKEVFGRILSIEREQDDAIESLDRLEAMDWTIE